MRSSNIYRQENSRCKVAVIVGATRSFGKRLLGSVNEQASSVINHQRDVPNKFCRLERIDCMWTSTRFWPHKLHNISALRFAMCDRSVWLRWFMDPREILAASEITRSLQLIMSTAKCFSSIFSRLQLTHVSGEGRRRVSAACVNGVQHDRLSKWPRTSG